MPTPGIHHVTAFAASPRTNFDFYTRALALRLVKTTVNYDDPQTYHLYFADRLGTPGTVMTFFPHPNARPGRHGSGQSSATAFAIPLGTIDFWAARLQKAGIDCRQTDRFNESALQFSDPDGLLLELIEHDLDDDQVQPWSTDAMEVDRAIRGFHSVTLTVRGTRPTVEFLQQLFAFHIVDDADGRTRLRAGETGRASIIDVVQSPDSPRGSFGPGTVHHVAWRAADEMALEQMRRNVIDTGFNVTEIKNRNYFRSIYFREPGGVIFEIATDGPGFTIDESEDRLGSGLMLPPWLEEDRARIESRLPPLPTAPIGD